MNHIIEVSLTPAESIQEGTLEEKILQSIHSSKEELKYYRVIKKSMDARKSPLYKYRVEISGSPFTDEVSYALRYKEVERGKRVLIIGAGPAGYFAALECLLMGLKPIVLDRGKDVQARRKDLRAIQQFSMVNPDSNYCFGEGGAGTYSDGKLYTRSNKRGDVQKVLKQLHEHGATAEILIDAHPHIGSNKLPEVIQNIRRTILHRGGEIHFGSKVIDFIIKGKAFKGVRCADGNTFEAEACILATGHSARDIFYLLQDHRLQIEAKAFALGVRVEHPQSLIDSIQYHTKTRDENLPAASYSLTCTLNNRGVFSFCMCPGGLIVPAATSPGELVVNGMSLSRRDSLYANSGMVANVFPEDFKTDDALNCLEYQKSVEQKVFNAGTGTQQAPAQRLIDFMNHKVSNGLKDTSYIPGIWSAPVHELLPAMIYNSLKEGLKYFGTKVPRYITNEAIVVATESRTSSPVRIPRNSLSMHPDCQGLFPCGEGAGYAGGIVSAAMDGQHCAVAAMQFLS